MATATQITNAILTIKSDAQCSVIGNESDNIDNIIWHDDNPTSISKSDIETKIAELQTAKDNEAQAKVDLKASAKAKLIAGEALTEDEANTIVL
tara:strand:- start:820 stop:1101 length:282 start_codon:yes stop_codon:yes gene_type:complete